MTFQRFLSAARRLRAKHDVTYTLKAETEKEKNISWNESPPGEKRLVAAALNKTFRTRHVVHDVSFSVHQAEIVGLFGPNGAGKSVSFSMVMGLCRPDSGRVLLDCTDITPLPIHVRARMGVSYVPQEPSIFRKIKVEANVRAIMQMRRDLSYTEQTERCEALLKAFQLTHVRNQRADTLSGGERKRVEIARALTVNPRFLIFDEPFSGIDPCAVQDIKRIIVRLAHSGVGILITDHNVRETLQITDRAYIIHCGHIIAQGSPQEVVRSSHVRQVYLGSQFQL